MQKELHRDEKQKLREVIEGIAKEQETKQEKKFTSAEIKEMVALISESLDNENQKKYKRDVERETYRKTKDEQGINADTIDARFKKIIRYFKIDKVGQRKTIFETHIGNDFYKDSPLLREILYEVNTSSEYNFSVTVSTFLIFCLLYDKIISDILRGNI